MNYKIFAERKTIEQVEEGNELSPNFDEIHGLKVELLDKSEILIPVVTTDFDTGEVLMLGWMNKEALKQTIEKKEAVYFSRSRKALWHKGSTSGLIQKVRQIRIDDDQDTIWLRVTVEGGASSHVGYRSCFFRSLDLENYDGNKPVSLKYEETEKVFDPVKVYGNNPNPTKL